MRINLSDKKNLLYLGGLILLGLLFSLTNVDSIQKAYGKRIDYTSISKIKPKIEILHHDYSQSSKENPFYTRQNALIEIDFPKNSKIIEGSGFETSLPAEGEIYFQGDDIEYPIMSTPKEGDEKEIVGTLKISETGTIYLNFQQSIEELTIEPIYIERRIIIDHNYDSDKFNIQLNLSNIKNPTETKTINSSIHVSTYNKDAFYDIGSGMQLNTNFYHETGQSSSHSNMFYNGTKAILSLQFKNSEILNQDLSFKLDIPSSSNHLIYFKTSGIKTPKAYEIKNSYNTVIGKVIVNLNNEIEILISRGFPVNSIFKVEIPFNIFANGIEQDGSYKINLNSLDHKTEFENTLINEVVFAKEGISTTASLQAMGKKIYYALDYTAGLYGLRKGDLIQIKFLRSDSEIDFYATTLDDNTYPIDVYLENGENVAKAYLMKQYNSEDKITVTTFDIIFIKSVSKKDANGTIPLYLSAVSDKPPKNDDIYTILTSVNGINEDFKFDYKKDSEEHHLITKDDGVYLGNDKIPGKYETALDKPIDELLNIRWSLKVNLFDLINKTINENKNRRENVIISDRVMAENHYIVKDSIRIVKILDIKNAKRNDLNNLIFDEDYIKLSNNNEETILSSNEEKTPYFNKRGITISEFINLNKEEKNLGIEYVYSKINAEKIIGFTLNLGNLNNFGYYIYYNTEIDSFEPKVIEDRDLTDYYENTANYKEDIKFFSDLASGKFELTLFDDTKKTKSSSLIIKKVDINGNPIKDVVFTLQSDVITKTAVTDEDGYASFEYLTNADYILKETVYPKGYRPIKPIKFSIHDYSQPFVDLTKEVPKVRRNIKYGKNVKLRGKTLITSQNDNLIVNYPIKSFNLKFYDAAPGIGTTSDEIIPSLALFSPILDTLEDLQPLNFDGTVSFDAIEPGNYELFPINPMNNEPLASSVLFAISKETLKEFPVDEDGYIEIRLDELDKDASIIAPEQKNSSTNQQQSPMGPMQLPSFSQPESGNNPENSEPPPIGPIAMKIEPPENPPNDTNPSNENNNDNDNANNNNNNSNNNNNNNDNNNNNNNNNSSDNNGLSYSYMPNTDTYTILDENNIPLGYIKVPENQSIENMNIDENIIPFNSPKANPNTRGR